MGLFTIFRSDINFQNLIEIRVGGQIDEDATKALPHIIGDIWVINDLKSSLKAAHMAYQDFGATFSYQMGALMQSESFTSLYQACRSRHSLCADEKAELSRLYRNAVSLADFTKRRDAIEDSDPNGSAHTYYVLRGLMDAPYEDRDYVEHLAKLKKTGDRFFRTAPAVLPGLLELERMVETGAILDMEPQIQAIIANTTSSASTADTLMDRAEKMLVVARRALARIIPDGEKLYQIPGLALREVH